MLQSRRSVLALLFLLFTSVLMFMGVFSYRGMGLSMVGGSSSSSRVHLSTLMAVDVAVRKKQPVLVLHLLLLSGGFSYRCVGITMVGGSRDSALRAH
jgi:hypothetical protein